MNDATLLFFTKINKFLNTHKEPFLITELAEALDMETTEENCEQLISFLVNESLAYFIPNEDEQELWISKHAFFTNKIFAVSISDYELERDIFIEGSRFLPFINLRNTVGSTKLLYKGKELPKKSDFMQFERASSFYFLSTENNISHTLCENNEKNIEIFSEADDSFAYNTNFEISAWDLSEIYEERNLKNQNKENRPRLFIKILDWEHGIFEITEEIAPKLEKKVMNDWFEAFDNAVKNALKILNIYATTYEVLSFAFFIYSELLFTKNPVAMELFFEERNTFSIRPYGIEEKFWITDEEIPTPSRWFTYPMDTDDALEKIFYENNTPLTSQVVYHLMLDNLRKNYARRFESEVKEEFISGLIELAIPDGSLEDKSTVSSLLSMAYDDFSETYNPFIDNDLKNIREDLVFFYKDILSQYSRIKKYRLKTTDLPDQSALVLAQITFKVLQAFDFISSLEDDDYEYLSILTISMENLAYVLGDIKVEITNTITNISKT